MKKKAPCTYAPRLKTANRNDSRVIPLKTGAPGGARERFWIGELHERYQCITMRGKGCQRKRRKNAYDPPPSDRPRPAAALPGGTEEARTDHTLPRSLTAVTGAYKLTPGDEGLRAVVSLAHPRVSRDSQVSLDC